MLISKFDLYNAEWLDIVFEDRNKAYGAYELRQHHDRTMVRAMAITFLTVGALAAGSLIFRKAIVHPDRGVVVVVQPPYVAPPKKIDPPKPEDPKPITHTKPMPPVATVKFVPPVVVPENHPIESAPTIDELNTQAISTETTKGTPSKYNDAPDKGTPGPPAPDNTLHNIGTVDVMPEPVGGEAAWAKFLNKNLRFPAVAQEEGLSGKVILSFIIEKDGSLSNIIVERGAGHGFDEEATRVLKLAKAWKPGMQNGQAVRVKYNIPINFQLSE